MNNLNGRNVKEWRKKNNNTKSIECSSMYALVCVCAAIAMFYLVNYSINLSEGKLNMK